MQSFSNLQLFLSSGYILQIKFEYTQQIHRVIWGFVQLQRFVQRRNIGKDMVRFIWGGKGRLGVGWGLVVGGQGLGLGKQK